MCLCLDLVEFIFGEICCRKNIVRAKAIDSPVKALCFLPVEVAAVDDSGEVVALSFKHLVLLFLVSWSFVSSQVFSCMGCLPLLDIKWLSVCVVQRYATRWVLDHGRLPCGCKFKDDGMVPTLREFKSLVTCCQYIVPHLAVSSRQGQELVQSQVIIFKGVDTGSDIVHKSNSFYLDLCLHIPALVCGPFGMLVVHIEKSAAYE